MKWPELVSAYMGKWSPTLSWSQGPICRLLSPFCFSTSGGSGAGTTARLEEGSRHTTAHTPSRQAPGPKAPFSSCTLPCHSNRDPPPGRRCSEHLNGLNGTFLQITSVSHVVSLPFYMWGNHSSPCVELGSGWWRPGLYPRECSHKHPFLLLILDNIFISRKKRLLQKEALGIKLNTTDRYNSVFT